MFSRKSSPVSARSAQSILEQSAQLLPQSSLARAYIKRRRGSASAKTSRPTRADAIKEWHDSKSEMIADGSWQSGAERPPKAFTKHFPAPRLVGVETNPGPGPRGGAASAAAVGYALANALAKTKKKKKPSSARKPKSASRRKGAARLQDSSVAVTNVPISRGIVYSSSGHHSPFILSGRAFASTVLLSTLNTTYMKNNLGATAACNNFVVDVLGESAFPDDFRFFPTTVYNVATSFVRYRVRKLVVTYTPGVGTATPGVFAMASAPEVSTTVNIMPYATVGNAENSISGPIWQPMSLNLLASGGLRKDWLFCDGNNTSISTSTNRQESPGQFLCSFSLTPVPSSTTDYGQLWIEYELEFDGVNNESQFGARRPRDPALPNPSDASSSSSPPSIPLPIPNRACSDSPEYETVHGTCCPTVTRGITTNFTLKQL